MNSSFQGPGLSSWPISIGAVLLSRSASNSALSLTVSVGRKGEELSSSTALRLRSNSDLSASFRGTLAANSFCLGTPAPSSGLSPVTGPSALLLRLADRLPYQNVKAPKAANKTAPNVAPIPIAVFDPVDRPLCPEGVGEAVWLEIFEIVDVADVEDVCELVPGFCDEIEDVKDVLEDDAEDVAEDGLLEELAESVDWDIVLVLEGSMNVSTVRHFRLNFCLPTLASEDDDDVAELEAELELADAPARAN